MVNHQSLLSLLISHVLELSNISCLAVEIFLELPTVTAMKKLESSVLVCCKQYLHAPCLIYNSGRYNPSDIEQTCWDFVWW